jgi:phospholipid/cholesterol/gamma-HCH transport system substrate-binding protein
VLVGFAKAQRWGTRYVDVYIQASDVNGLNHGEDIRIAGIVAGQVGTMHLNDQGEVKVKLKIEANKSHLVGLSSKASLAKEGLIGEPYLVITADPRPREQAQEIEGRTIAYEEPINIDVLLKELASSQQLLNVTLRNTTALTAADGSISTAFNSTRRLAESLQKEVAATAPLVRESMTSVAKDLQAVSDSTTAVEQDTRSLIETTQPLVVETLKDADQLTRSSQELVDILRNLFGSWLEPVDGHRDAMKKQDSTTK